MIGRCHKVRKRILQAIGPSQGKLAPRLVSLEVSQSQRQGQIGRNGNRAKLWVSNSLRGGGVRQLVTAVTMTQPPKGWRLTSLQALARPRMRTSDIHILPPGLEVRGQRPHPLSVSGFLLWQAVRIPSQRLSFQLLTE